VTEGRYAVAVDVVVFAVRDAELQVLLIRRGIEPFCDRWALPGGFVRARETVEEAAARELEEETRVKGLYLEQLQTFSAPDRDPRERVISVAHVALLPADRTKDAVEGGSDAREAAWHRVSTVLSRKSRRVALAFDHEAILGVALERLRARTLSTAVAFRLLPREFTLSEAQRVHEIVLGHPVDKVTFRRRLAALALVRETPRMRHGPHRPARLYVAADL
jgi:8-oxo-dGTP diphosphatase